MRTNRLRTWATLTCMVAGAGLTVVGCGDDDGPPVGVDAGPADSGIGGTDAGGGLDAGNPGDAGDASDAGSASAELSYDLGTAEEAFSPWGSATHVLVAVQFTAPVYPARLVRARFWVTDNGIPTTSFGVRVFAADGAGGMPGTSLLDAGVVTAAATAGSQWAEADLTAADLTATGDFYVAMDWLTAPGPMGASAQFLGADHHAPARRTWWYVGGAWTRVENVGRPSVDRNAMIRCTVE